GQPGAITGPMVTMGAVAGDPVALASFEAVGTWRGHGMAALAAVLAPRVFIIGGGVPEAAELLVRPARETFQANLTARGHRPVASVRVAQLGQDAGLIGAADLSRRGRGGCPACQAPASGVRYRSMCTLHNLASPGHDGRWSPGCWRGRASIHARPSALPRGGTGRSPPSVRSPVRSYSRGRRPYWRAWLVSSRARRSSAGRSSWVNSTRCWTGPGRAGRRWCWSPATPGGARDRKSTRLKPS